MSTTPKATAPCPYCQQGMFVYVDVLDTTRPIVEYACTKCHSTLGIIAPAPEEDDPHAPEAP